ncbi:hypothetical protein [Alteromonas ponticola]|uniref:STAS/SEC14 domain-containing protein n=1 Tax=Alteromonas ponticola TaxID=2720613 RepID=A0ABX1R304_9ALTE|nr:hypothetical protein [Alteromonas ponticola]NMH60830.1 hypothetical protein [Alteromonas ponticola]
MSSFAIRSVKNLILIKFSGDWSMSTDLSYLSELAGHISNFKSRKYGVFVDMRQWQLKPSVERQISKTDVRFDRRSQKGECWLQATPDQGNYLVKFFEGLRFPLYRTTEVSEALDWANDLVDSELVDAIQLWIDTDINHIEKIFPSN